MTHERREPERSEHAGEGEQHGQPGRDEGAEGKNQDD
jgi:hypothetical protein